MDFENYKPRHNNYQPLRDLHQQSSRDEEPKHPEKHYGGRYAQGDGDYVSETTAARINDGMINRDYHAAATTREGMRDADLDKRQTDKTNSPEKSKDEQTREKQDAIRELAQKLGSSQQSPDREREQER